MIRAIRDVHRRHIWSPSDDPGVIESTTWDACVIGSGPGGAVAAATLAEAGWRVLIVERGAFRPPTDMNFQVLDMAMRLGRLEWTSGGKTTLHTGSALGGGSVIFGAVAMQPPQFVFDEWRNASGVEALSRDVLAPHYDYVGHVMSVTRQTPHQENRANAIVREMADALDCPQGLELAARYTEGCRGTGLCPLGCGFDLKGTMVNSFLPIALDTGNLTILTECEAFALESEDTGAGRRATVLHTSRCTIRARYFITAAGSLSSSGVLLRSRLYLRPSGDRPVWLQPHGAIYALFDDPVTPGGLGADGRYLPSNGVPAIYHFTGLLRQRRYYWFASSIHPATFASYIAHLPPDEHQRVMSRFHYVSGVTLTMRDAPARSHIALRRGAPQLDFEESVSDVETLRQCLLDASRALLAVGARQVFLPMLQPPRIENSRDLREIERMPLSYDRLLLYSDHTSGGNPLGARPDRGATDAYGRVRGTTNVHVADASLFPSACGVAPSWTIMALSRMVALNLVAAA
jgi:choline dehydrogenase-like flavoprotein